MNYQNMSVGDLAQEIHRDWKKPYFGAIPYLEAMYQLRHIRDNYGCDSGKEVVLRFLSNASTWKGPVAREIKAELSRRCKS
jgi:hypothetical protein